jgi:DNA-binding MarR family transcriptional regulator
MKLTEKLEREELFGILTGRISLIVNRYLSNKFREANLGVTVEQWTVLACLWEKDKVSQQSLSEITLRDQPSMTRLIDNLEKQKMVVRVADPTDRRSNLIFLTEKGMALEKKATEIVKETIDKALISISNEDIFICRTTLKKILGNLN